MNFNSKKTTFTAAIIAASFFFTAVPFSGAKAGENNKIAKAGESAKAFTLTTNFMGEKNNSILIRVATSQENSGRSYLRIYDNNDELLYEEMIFTTAGVKLISISPEELKSIRIVYSSAANEIKKVLAVNTISKTTYSISETAKLK